MTSSNGNIFRVTGPLCREFTGPGEFPAQRPVTRSFDVFFDLRLNKRFGKQSWGWWFETLSGSLWRQCNDLTLLSLWGLLTSLNVIGGWLVRSTLRITVARCQSLLTCPLCWDLWKTNWWWNVLNYQPTSSRNPASSFFPSGPLSNSKLKASHPNVLQWISVPLPLKRPNVNPLLVLRESTEPLPSSSGAPRTKSNINEFPFFFHYLLILFVTILSSGIRKVPRSVLLWWCDRFAWVLRGYYTGTGTVHDDVIKWKHFPRYWPFVRGIHQSPVNSPQKGQWRGALMFFFDLHPNKRLSKQSWGWWFETPPCPLWRHSNASRDSPGAVGVIPWSARISPLIIQKIFVWTLFMEYHQRVCWCFGAIRRQSICRRVVCNFLECHCEGLFSIFITGNFSECVIILTMYPFKRIAAIINNVYYLQLLYDMFVFLNFHYSFPYGSLSTSGSYMF